MNGRVTLSMLSDPPSAARYLCELKEHVAPLRESASPHYYANRGVFGGEVAFRRFVEDDGNRMGPDNSANIAFRLRELAEVLMAFDGLEFGRAQIFVVVEKKVRPEPTPPEEPFMPKVLRGRGERVHPAAKGKKKHARKEVKSWKKAQ